MIRIFKEENMNQDSFFDLTETNVMVEFKITGDIFDEELINQKLSILPSVYWKKGDVIENSNQCRESTCWTLSTGYEVSMDINIQLTKIIDKLYSKWNKLLELSQKINVSYMIDIVVNIENGETPIIYFNSRNIEFAHAIGSEIGLDLYIYS